MDLLRNIFLFVVLPFYSFTGLVSMFVFGFNYYLHTFVQVETIINTFIYNFDVIVW